MADRFQRASVLSAFESLYGGSPRLFRAPARINIIGEHTDYNDGLVMPANMDLYTWLAIAPRGDRRVNMRSLNFDGCSEIDLDDLRAERSGGWQEYPKGVFDVLQREGYALCGADIVVGGDIPLQSGLSSSASIEAAVGYAMLSCAGHDIDRARLAVLCQRAENEFVGLQCGIMDQFVIATCHRNHAVMLDCRSLDSEYVSLPGGLRILILHSGIHRQLRDGGYNTRRQECERATELLAQKVDKVTTLRDVTIDMLEAHRDLLGDVLYRRARHVVTENIRVSAAHRALLSNDADSLGKAITASHESLRDDFEVSCDEVDALVEIALKCDGVYGSRMVGGGFGGCVIAAVHADNAADALSAMQNEYTRHSGHKPWGHVLGPADPVSEVPLT